MTTSSLPHNARAAALLIVLGLAGGCASIPDTVRSYGPGSAQVELTEVPFYPQEKYQCGPAALATVLSHAGAAATPEELVQRVYLPGRSGTLQAEMLAGVRAAGYIPYQIDGKLEAVAQELAGGRPVLVLQNLGVSWYPRWHYAVAVGIDPVKETVILRSGTDARRITSTDTFLRTWRRSDYWAVVVLPPGTLPAQPDRQRYLRVAAEMESVGQYRAAQAAWKAARHEWPDDVEAMFGLANAELGLGNPERAEVLYRRILVIRPKDLAVHNNLAYALAQQGLVDSAIHQLQTALALPPDEPDSELRLELLSSLADLRSGFALDGRR